MPGFLGKCPPPGACCLSAARMGWPTMSATARWPSGLWAYVHGDDLAHKGVVVAHLDHGYSIEECEAARDAGFTSLMFDGSRLPLSENIEQTARVVKLAHEAGISCEGEIGFAMTLFGQNSYGAREEGKDWTGNSTYHYAIAGAVCQGGFGGHISNLALGLYDVELWSSQGELLSQLERALDRPDRLLVVYFSPAQWVPRVTIHVPKRAAGGPGRGCSVPAACPRRSDPRRGARIPGGAGPG
mgnify:CR=1 FL=1